MNTDDTSIEELLAQSGDLATRSMTDNTLRSYTADWRDFSQWCRKRRASPCPADPKIVAAYLTARAPDYKAASLARRLAMIGKVHRLRGLASPTEDPRVRSTWRGIQQRKGDATSRRPPLLIEDLRAMITAVPETLSGARDRALLLLGFSGAMRRSDLTYLDVTDLSVGKEGLLVKVRTRAGSNIKSARTIAIPYGAQRETCPVRAVLSWLDRAGIDEGPLLRKVNRFGRVEERRLSAYSVALIVKRAIERIGKDPSSFSAHSLRAGLAVAAARAGADERSIQNQTGHRSLKALRVYIEESALFRNNAVKKIGL